MIPVIICITGMPGSGKTEAAKILNRLGFTMEEMGDEVRKLAKERANAVERPDVWRFAEELKAKMGMAVIAESMAGRLNADSDIVISGLRNAEELSVFKRLLGSNLIVLSITAPQDMRYFRLLQRDRVRSYEEFLERERNEVDGLGQSSITGMADARIENTGSLEDLRKSIEELLG